MPKTPNLLILYTDQQRRDSLGCYGNAAARTPHLDALAARGLRFEEHYASCTVCMPSRASFFTGRPLPAHGLIDNGIPLDDRRLTLPQALSRAGYDTCAVGKVHLTPYLADEDSGMAESMAAWQSGRLDGWDGPYYGFDRVELSLGHGEGAARHAHYGRWVRERFGDPENRLGPGNAPDPKYPSLSSWRSALPVGAHTSTWVAERTIEYLRSRDGSRPFFCFASFPDPHHPFTPPAEIAALFDGLTLPAPRYRPGENETKPRHYREALTRQLHPQDGGATRPPELTGDALRQIIAHTHAMVHLIDLSVGRILAALEDAGLADETVVVFTCDHGELLGDHGLLFKGPYPCRSLLYLPLLAAGPGIGQGAIRSPMSNADLFPTLMDLLGLPVPAEVSGHSLAPAIRGEPGSVPAAAFSCGWSKESAYYRHLSLHRPDWRISLFPGLEDGELYDLAADPDEQENLFHRPEHRATREALLADLCRAYVEAGPLESPARLPW